MELRVLRYFLAVAGAESISGAAEALHLTQPTLSRQLINMEEELGKKLFVRGGRRVTLTEDGVLLRKRAGEIVELVEKTEAELGEAGESIGGDVRIGAGETDAMRLIARTARTMREEHPRVRFHLFSGNAQDVTERLDKGLLDFGILIEPADIRKYDFVRLPAADAWGLLMPGGHPLANRAAVRPEDLYGLPIIASRQALLHNELSGWLGRTFESLDVAATYNLLFNAALMVEEGVGCALCLDKLAGAMGERGLCFRPLEPPLEVGLDMVWKKHQVFSRAAKKFLERVRALCEPGTSA